MKSITATLLALAATIISAVPAEPSVEYVGEPIFAIGGTDQNNLPRPALARRVANTSSPPTTTRKSTSSTTTSRKTSSSTTTSTTVRKSTSTTTTSRKTSSLTTSLKTSSLTTTRKTSSSTSTTPKPTSSTTTLPKTTSTTSSLITASVPAATEIQNALQVHNDARAKHNEVALVWDTGLQAKAQDWANQLAIMKTLKHNTSGENLYYRYPPTAQDLTLASKAWVAEEPMYHGEKIPDGNFSQYGHYTQVVWSTTLRVGIAWARDDSGHSYVVARYDPVGNWVGKTPY